MADEPLSPRKALGSGGAVRAARAVGGPPGARVRDLVRADGDGGRRADGALRRSAGAVSAGPTGPQVRFVDLTPLLGREK